jgi:transcriptional regulator with XRE-family HTH domain
MYLAGVSLGQRPPGALNMGDVDIHVGKRLRRRRRLLGLTQLELGTAIGTRFQQIQKYECGANRVSAARLYQIACALGVPTTYFFDGLPPAHDSESAAGAEPFGDVMNQAETIELVRAYYMLGERPRRRLLDLARALREDNLSVA